MKTKKAQTTQTTTARERVTTKKTCYRPAPLPHCCPLRRLAQMLQRRRPLGLLAETLHQPGGPPGLPGKTLQCLCRTRLLPQSEKDRGVHHQLCCPRVAPQSWPPSPDRAATLQLRPHPFPEEGRLQPRRRGPWPPRLPLLPLSLPSNAGYGSRRLWSPMSSRQ
ncbi:hypothetical protein I4F81_001367 [Pyropia yezoensis]|uniref:Uncharacterized protein n=1 Tax=Pyropia yezoensis TaxID=2788 RepID=A0ACC3BLB4_PYRYE|nr:hypothetical protein I4F81_001367 [Neopyropia yezoensis]